MNSSRLVSIIVPIYNVEKYFTKCLESLINQTYQNIEIILVDDGSTDNSKAICDNYAQKDKRIIVIHKMNEGVAQARIDGFNRSSGELVTFIDSDDYVDLSYIEKLVTPFDQYEIDLSICDYYIVSKGSVSHINRTVQGLLVGEQIDKMIATQYLYDNNNKCAGLPLYLWTKMIKREFVLDALEYAKGMWMCEDQVVSFHILKRIKSMYVFLEPLYYYVKHDGQATSIYKPSLWTNQFECWERYKKLDTYNLLAHQLPVRMWWTVKRNFRKMRNYKISYQEFKRDMVIVEDFPIWRELLSNSKLPQGKREKLSFFFLKHKLYYPFYRFLLHRI